MAFLKPQDIKVLYMGTPAMSASILEALVANGFSLVGVVCQEDKEIGRDKTAEIVPTKKVALAHAIPVFQPHKIRLDFAFAKTLDFDVIVTMAYGQIIPQGLLDLAKVGSLNLHGSLLPKYRGAAPIQRAIMAGEKETGVTLMEMVAAMDAGKMYDKASFPLLDSDNYTSVCAKISSAATQLIVKDLLPYANKEIAGEEQKEKDVTIANKIKPEDERLPLSLSVNDAWNYVRGLSEEPGAYLLLNGKKLKIYAAHVENGAVIRSVGEMIPNKKKLLVQYYDGQLSLDVVQLEGKKKMDAASFLNGAHLSDHVLFK
ncbi:MAG: methionyl-tRNA formyltransferase [Bacilli bacterium]